MSRGVRADVYALVQAGVFGGILGFLHNDDPHKPAGDTEAEEQRDAERQAELATNRVMISVQEYLVFDDPHKRREPVRRRKRRGR